MYFSLAVFPLCLRFTLWQNKSEGLNYYLFAGLKFLECCQQLEVWKHNNKKNGSAIASPHHLLQKEAETKHDGLKAAVVMYRETAKFLDNCGAMCLSSKEQSRASLW